MNDYYHGKPLKIGQTTQFLFDDFMVEDVWNLKRVSQQPTKFSGNPVVAADQPAEYNCYDNHVIRDPETGLFRMWYQDHDTEAHFTPNPQAGSADGHPDFCRYAESEDGIHWTKPKLGILQHHGSAQNNIVLAGVRECDRSSVVANPEPENEDRRYIMAYLDQPKGESGICLAYSPDGIHWTPDPENPVIQGHYDCVSTPVWDPSRKIWLCYSRPTVNAFGLVRPDRGWIDSDPELGIFRHHRRRVSVAVSKDLVHWNKMRNVLFPDELDADWPDIDHFRPFFRNGMFLGFSAYVDPTGYQCGQPRLAWSHDGFHWHEPPDRKWFLPPGPEGSFDDGWVLGPSAPVRVGSQMWFYYGGQRKPERMGNDIAFDSGLAKLPVDRFLAQQAGPDPGSLLTREVTIEGRELHLNFATEHHHSDVYGMARMGEIRVELVEALPAKNAVVGGRSIDGFTMAECDAARGNSTDHPVTWRGRRNLADLKNRPVHLRFRLTNASVFTFTFTDKVT